MTGSTEKFEELVHFIIHECRDNPRKLGAIKLNKVAYYADVEAFRRKGSPIAESGYIKRRLGPVPKNILKTLRKLKEAGAIEIEEPVIMYEPRLFRSLKEPALKHLTEDEQNLIRLIIDYVTERTANCISEETHDIVWEAAHEGEEIPVYATLAANFGDITDEVLEWAESHIAKEAA